MDSKNSKRRLIIINEELNQNQEKEDRAAELFIANK
jgi:hypothetical protein